ncbi:MAG: methyl-accepting chemotaxis protein [Synergistaceae bacterium]|jgi:methyl-accepting chemotaxis protein|nr:methyl-accepting chemotaxis protein [Synergistaceae bacterium]
MKISTKLLLGFCLVLAVFSFAVAMTWDSLAALQADNSYMQSAVVPGMELVSHGQQAVYEVFLAADTMTLTETEESIRAVNAAKASVQERLADVGGFMGSYPDVKALIYARDNVGPTIDTYFQMLEATEKAIQKKNATFGILVNEGEKLTESSVSYVKDLFAYVTDELRNGRATEEHMSVLDSAQIIRTNILLLRYTILRNISNNDVATLRSSVSKTIEDTEVILQHLRDTASQPRFQTATSVLLNEISEYKKFLLTFIEDFNALQKIHADRAPAMASLNTASSSASKVGQDQVAELAKTTLDSLRTCVTLLILAAVAAILLGVAIAFLLSRSITKPLSSIVALAQRAGEGDLTIVKKDFHYEGKDELGILADSLFEMIRSQEETLTKVISVAENLSNGANNLSAISEETNALMKEVKASVEQVSTLSEGNSIALEECNAGVEEMNAGADTVAQSATDSAASIAQTTEVSHRAIQMVNNVIQGMHNVDTNSKESENKIRQLVSSVENVGGFVTVITGIADQTNLLALNAAIEAARAGEVGRGFAVVAEEVRKLAEESAHAAQNVNNIILELQNGAQESIDATVEAAHALEETIAQAEQAQVELDGAMIEINKANGSIQSIAAVAKEQAASSKGVATGIDNATKSTMEMVNTISSIRRASEETAQAAQTVAKQSESMSDYAQSLMDALSRFKLNIDRSDNALRKKGLVQKAMLAPNVRTTKRQI